MRERKALLNNAEKSKSISLHERHVLSFVTHYHAWTHRHIHGSLVWDVLLQCVHVRAWDGERASLKDEQEWGVKDQMGWAGKGSTGRGGRNRNGVMNDVKKRTGRADRWLHLIMEMKKVAMSWIMPNQLKGCFQMDVLREACALAGAT